MGVHARWKQPGERMHVKLRMRYDRLLLIDGVVFLIYSMGALIFTRDMLDLHGVVLNQPGVFTAQIAGAAFFAFSAINLLSREISDVKALHLIMNGNLVKHFISLFVCIGNFFSGGLNDNRSLSFVLLFLVFTLAYSYFHFSQREYATTGLEDS